MTSIKNSQGFSTRAIHAGQRPDPTTGAVMTPIYQVSTYAQETVGGHKGYEYSRTDNPTRTPLQECLAALEGARFGLVFASGLAATDTLVRTLVKPGDLVICGDDVYGGTYRLFDKVHRHWGLPRVDREGVEARAGGGALHHAPRVACRDAM